MILLDGIKLFISNLKYHKKIKKELNKTYIRILFEPRTEVKILILQTSFDIISKMLKEDEQNKYKKKI
jgi:hypothetical protein